MVLNKPQVEGNQDIPQPLKNTYKKWEGLSAVVALDLSLVATKDPSHKNLVFHQYW